MWEWALLLLFILVALYVFSHIKKEPGCSQCPKNMSINNGT